MNSYKFFENRQCEYYPCHPNMKEINCLFCYCPLYGRKLCIHKKYKDYQNCKNCTFPHERSNYYQIISILKG